MMIRSREARNRAREVLKMVAVTQPPVDVHDIAKYLGFTVIPFGFPDSTSAVTFVEGDVKSIGVPVIATSKERWRGQVRDGPP